MSPNLQVKWKPHAYAATVDIAAAHLARTNAWVLSHLQDANENLQKAIEEARHAVDAEGQNIGGDAR